LGSSASVGLVRQLRWPPWVEISIPCVPLRIPTLKGIGQQTPGSPVDVARLDQFQLMRRLGGGGMADVFLATERSNGRRVVIKRLRPNLIKTQNFLGMFLDEIQVTARLDHPHLVKLADPGYSLTEWFLVLEPIMGVPLSKLLRHLAKPASRSSLLSPTVVALLGGQIASGLHHAHIMRDEGGNPMNVVHRDVSPENIMVTVSGRAKLIDFGVAKLTGCAGHTRPGDIKGKFGYMAPEQVRTAEPITPRTDVFALGVVLWEMLVGKRLFLRKSPADSLRALLEERVPHPNELRQIGPFLDGIVMRALCPDPARRFASAGQMADALFGIVGRDRKSVEAELAERVGLASHNEGAAAAADSEPPGSTISGLVVRRRLPTPDIRTARFPRAELSHDLPRPPSPSPRRRGNRLLVRTRARDLGRRFWRSLSRPVVSLGLASLLVLDVALRLLGLGSTAPTIHTVPSPSTATISAPRGSPIIIEPLPLLLRTFVPANDVNGSASEISRRAANHPSNLRPSVASTGKLRRRLMNQAHPPRAVRSRGATPAVGARPPSSRRTRPPHR
jgi:hypothetical protein